MALPEPVPVLSSVSGISPNPRTVGEDQPRLTTEIVRRAISQPASRSPNNCDGWPIGDRPQLSRIIDLLSGLTSPWLYVIIGALAAAESAALVGLVVPGEAALLIGGVIASQGHVDLWLLIAIATIAAVVGDSIGYEVGRATGPALRSTRIGRWVGDERWQRVDAYVLRRGAHAVFFGRWVGVLRALVPGVAGMTSMPYRKFIVWNVLGAVTWAPAVVLAGYVAGNSYRTVERWLGAASLIIVAIVVVAVGGSLATRWMIEHRDKALAFGSRVRALPAIDGPIRLVARLSSPALEWSRPYWAFTVITVIALTIIGGAGWALSALVDSIVGTESIARLDQPVASWFSEHTTSWATSTFQAISVVGGGVGAGIVAALVTLTRRRTQSTWRSGMVMLTALTGALFTSQAINYFTNRPGPTVDGTTLSAQAFPSGHTAIAVAVFGAAAYLISNQRSWRQQVIIWSGAIFIGFVVGVARAYLGGHWLTDIVGGWLLGTAILTAVIAADAVLNLGSGREIDSAKPMP